MRLFILLCQLFVTLFMVVVILFQKSESSLGLGGGTMGGMMTAWNGQPFNEINSVLGRVVYYSQPLACVFGEAGSAE